MLEVPVISKQLGQEVGLNQEKEAFLEVGAGVVLEPNHLPEVPQSRIALVHQDQDREADLIQEVG